MEDDFRPRLSYKEKAKYTFMRMRSEAQKENVGRGEGKGARNGLGLCGAWLISAAPNQNKNNRQDGDILNLLKLDFM